MRRRRRKPALGERKFTYLAKFRMEFSLESEATQNGACLTSTLLHQKGQATESVIIIICFRPCVMGNESSCSSRSALSYRFKSIFLANSSKPAILLETTARVLFQLFPSNLSIATGNSFGLPRKQRINQHAQQKTRIFRALGRYMENNGSFVFWTNFVPS